MSRFHKGILPREGFHADVVGSLLSTTLLNPWLTLPAYLGARYTDVGRDLVAKYLSPRAWTAATVLTAWGVLRSLQSYLDRRALNNGVGDTYNWPNELVVVTGGADGIGKDISLMFAEHTKVVVLDVQALTYDAPKNLYFIKTDITSEEALRAAHEEIKVRVGRSPSVIILNAGVCRGKSILDTTKKDAEITFNVNTIANFLLMREFLPDIVKNNHGTIVTVASSAAWITAPMMADYAGSKAAALSFHEALGAELVSIYKAPKVRTIVVNQGYVRTALFKGFGIKEGFVGPPLEVGTISEAIVRQVMRGQSGQIILPAAPLLLMCHFRSFSHYLQHKGRCGMTNLMAGWTGRQVKELNLAGKN